MRSGHAHHCEAPPPGHRLKRPTKGGANRSRTNNAPPPCENQAANPFWLCELLLNLSCRTEAARRAAPLLAVSAASCTCLVNGNMSGYRRAFSNAVGSILRASAWAAPFSSTATRLFSTRINVGIEVIRLKLGIAPAHYCAGVGARLWPFSFMSCNSFGSN